MPDIGQLARDFAVADSDAQAWGGTPDEFEDAPDCDIMSLRFIAYLLDRPGDRPAGPQARLVRVMPVNHLDDMLTGPHWFVEVEGLGIDWTARQFYNVEGVHLDPSEIPCPLVFLWPGQYPIPTIEWEES